MSVSYLSNEQWLDSLKKQVQMHKIKREQALLRIELAEKDKQFADKEIRRLTDEYLKKEQEMSA